MITDRQRQILNSLIQEYLKITEPISSELLKEKCGLSVSPATIRNELQELTELGYITQPHTSAGRVPTNKGYRYFVQITFTTRPESTKFIFGKLEETKQKIDKEAVNSDEKKEGVMHPGQKISL